MASEILAAVLLGTRRRISIWVEIGAHCLGIISVLIALVEAAQLWLPFYQYNQRVTHGSAR